MNDKPYILAIDQGTTSCRALAFDREGRVAAVAQREFTQSYPQPGWVEHDASEIWRVQKGVLHEAAAAVGGAEKIAGIGITNQRETTVLWDRSTGEPVGPAIVWQCRRSTDICARLRAEGREPFVRERTGLLLDPYFSGTKLTWRFEQDAELRRRAEAGEVLFGTIDSWLLWNLSGGKVHATDPSNASRTLLYSLHTRRWDDELLALFGVPEACLPEIRPSSGLFCTTDVLGEGTSIPVAGIAGDQQAALFGQACHSPGMAKNTYGTGCFLLMHAGDKPRVPENGLLGTVAWEIDGVTEYAVEGSVFVAGAAVQWLRDGLGLIETAGETETLARSVEDTGGVYLVPAFTGLGTPYWKPEARGLICGLTRGTSRAHIVRAALESIAYQSRDLCEAIAKSSGVPLRTLRVDGGATANGFLMQFQADILGLLVERPANRETTALGAAFLAGLAVGFWSSREELASLWKADGHFTPAMNETDRERLWAGWKNAVGYQL